jgi:hypothetical protein
MASASSNLPWLDDPDAVILPTFLALSAEGILFTDWPPWQTGSSGASLLHYEEAPC